MIKLRSFQSKDLERILKNGLRRHGTHIEENTYFAVLGSETWIETFKTCEMIWPFQGLKGVVKRDFSAAFQTVTTNWILHVRHLSQRFPMHTNRFPTYLTCRVG